MSKIELLRRVPIFSFMDDQEIHSIYLSMEEHTFAPGQVIIHEGDYGDLFFIVIEGKAEFLVLGTNNHELILGTVEMGGFFGELSMLSGEPRSIRVRAVTNVSTLALKRDQFFHFLEQQPAAAIDVLKILSQRLYRTNSLLRSSVSRNVNDILDEKLTLFQRIADIIADFSGSIPFLMINIVLFAFWLIWNSIPSIAFDPYPFGLLTMGVSLEAIFLSIFLLISSNRQAAKDRVAAEIDHQVNTKAELEIGLLLQRFDDFEQRLDFNYTEHTRLLRDRIGEGHQSSGPS